MYLWVGKKAAARGGGGLEWEPDKEHGKKALPHSAPQRSSATHLKREGCRQPVGAGGLRLRCGLRLRRQLRQPLALGPRSVGGHPHLRLRSVLGKSSWHMAKTWTLNFVGKLRLAGIRQRQAERSPEVVGAAAVDAKPCHAPSQPQAAASMLACAAASCCSSCRLAPLSSSSSAACAFTRPSPARTTPSSCNKRQTDMD